MNKEKIINACLWLSGFSFCVIFAALSLYIGFNNHRHGNNTILIIGILLLPVVFYCAYKAIKLLLESIFE